MHGGNELQGLAHSQPFRQDRHVRNEAHVPHQFIPLSSRVTAEDLQLPGEGCQAQNGLERGGLACPVRTDESDDPSGLHREAHAIERPQCAKGLGETPGFNHFCH